MSSKRVKKVVNYKEEKDEQEENDEEEDDEKGDFSSHQNSSQVINYV